MRIELLQRGVVFLLASLSFACLLGEFAGVWSMHWFGCWVLPPATVALGVIAWRDKGSQGRATPTIWGPRQWIVEGAIGGLVAAVAYDFYRLPFVLAGTPLFKVFGQFGKLLLGGAGPPWLVQLVGWTYHFSNGAALGIMFLAMMVRFTPRRLFWGAVLWALVVELILLQTPYARYFGLSLNAWFIFLTASAHLIFGIVLGLWLRRRIPAATY
jgi:hypothetical protein